MHPVLSCMWNHATYLYHRYMVYPSAQTGSPRDPHRESGGSGTWNQKACWRYESVVTLGLDLVDASRRSYKGRKFRRTQSTRHSAPQTIRLRIHVTPGQRHRREGCGVTMFGRGWCHPTMWRIRPRQFPFPVSLLSLPRSTPDEVPAGTAARDTM